MTYEEFNEYMKSQGLSDSEIEDIIDWYNLDPDNIGDESDWSVNFVEDADTWVKDICDSITTDTYGDIGSFLKLHYISDYGQFASEYAEYLLDQDDSYAVYCPSTNRVVFFEA